MVYAYSYNYLIKEEGIRIYKQQHSLKQIFNWNTMRLFDTMPFNGVHRIIFYIKPLVFIIIFGWV